MVTPNFVTMGNSYYPNILYDNLWYLQKVYPDSEVYLYDWGYKRSELEKFKKANKNLRIISWISPNELRYLMYQKIVCMLDCFKKHHDRPLIYFDNDAIVVDRVDEIFNDRWDIGGTCRPRLMIYGEIPNWLSAGVIFMNNINIENTLAFLSEFEKRGRIWKRVTWCVDQVELNRLFSMINKDFGKYPDNKGKLTIGNKKVTLKTFDCNVYNFFPEMVNPYKGYYNTLPKILHLRSGGTRRIKHSILPTPMRRMWINMVATNYYGSTILKKLNYGFNKMLRVLELMGYTGR